MSTRRVFANDTELNFSEYNRRIQIARIQQNLISHKFADYNTFLNFKRIYSHCELPCSINAAVKSYNNCWCHHHNCTKSLYCVEKCPPVIKIINECSGINCCYYCANGSCCGKCILLYNKYNKFNRYNIYNRYTINSNTNNDPVTPILDKKVVVIPPPNPFNNQINLP